MENLIFGIDLSQTDKTKYFVNLKTDNKDRYISSTKDNKYFYRIDKEKVYLSQEQTDKLNELKSEYGQ